MSNFKKLYEQGQITVNEEEPNNKNRAKFRHFSRQVSGAVFDVPENNKVLFSYEKQYTKTFQTGQISFSMADTNMQQPEDFFDSEYFPQLTFLFVHRDFQGHGYGTLLVKEGLKLIREQCLERPVRVQSAMCAVGFFEKCGFRVVSEPYNCGNSGPKIFRTLVDMQLDCNS